MSATRETRVAIVESAARWACNMLVEVLHNYGSALTKERADCLRRATTALSDFQAAAREHV